MILEQRISKTRYGILAGGGLLISLLIWVLLTFTGFIKPFFLPPPEKVFLAFISLTVKGGLMSDIAASMYRILLGSFLSLAIALPVGIALGVSKRFEAFTEPLIAFVRYIPPSAFIPLAIIWFGI
ncbi:MAG: NitT/TauT family transport system permease protein, partial [Parcubacteria group bacterium Gr01-1014_33]